MTATSAAELLRQARTRAGLTQHELAERAGVQQSVISVYESGRRQPSLPTLSAMIDAAGFSLELQLKRQPSLRHQLTGPVGQRVSAHRKELLKVAAAHDVLIIGVFGSVARGEDSADSDIDLLVELPAGMGVIALGRFQRAVEKLVGARVDLVPETDLKPGVSAHVRRDLVPL